MNIDEHAQAQASIDEDLMGNIPESTGPQIDKISNSEVLTACRNSSTNYSNDLVNDFFFQMSRQNYIRILFVSYSQFGHNHGVMESSNALTVAVVNPSVADDDVTSGVPSSSGAILEAVGDVGVDLFGNCNSFLLNLPIN